MVNVSSSPLGRHLEVAVKADTHDNSEAIRALAQAAKASPMYQLAKGRYELRMVHREGQNFLQLHANDAISRTSAFLKGVFKGVRTQRNEARNEERQAAAAFMLDHSGLKDQLKGLGKTAAEARGQAKQLLKDASTVDPLVGVMLDMDHQAVNADVNSAMNKLRDRLLSHPELMENLHVKGPASRTYAKQLASGNQLDKLLTNWKPTWPTENTCGLMLDVATQLAKTSNSDLKAGASRGAVSDSTLKLLGSLTQDKDITPREIEAVMNGVSAYWNKAIVQNITGEFNATPQVWRSYNQVLLDPTKAIRPAPSVAHPKQYVQAQDRQLCFMHAWNAYQNQPLLHAKDFLKTRNQVYTSVNILSQKQMGFDTFTPDDFAPTAQTDLAGMDFLFPKLEVAHGARVRDSGFPWSKVTIHHPGGAADPARMDAELQKMADSSKSQRFIVHHAGHFFFLGREPSGLWVKADSIGQVVIRASSPAQLLGWPSVGDYTFLTQENRAAQPGEGVRQSLKEI